MKTLQMTPAIKSEAGIQQNGFKLRQIVESRFSGLLDPVIFIDHFWLSEPVFSPHPHAGFSPVTLLFEDSAGGIDNRDSRGIHSLVQPGDLQWTLAGRGVVHEEKPIENGLTSHGLQIFVNLSAANKLIAPESHLVKAAEMPVFETDKVRVRVASGETNGLKSPLVLPEPFTLLDVFISPNGCFRHEIPAGWNALVYVVSGETSVCVKRDLRNLSQYDATAIGAGDEGVTLEMSSATGVHAVVLSGKALNEPLVMHGPFAMNNRDQIRQAIADYQSGKMGII